MRPIRSLAALSLAAAVALSAAPAGAGVFFFSTGLPDGKMAALSRPSTGGVLETETADDFVLDASTRLTSATFNGLITGAAAPGAIGQVAVEIYRVFPQDSDVGRTSGSPLFGTPQVPTRVNSPSDVAFTSADSGGGTLSFSVASLGTFSAGNSVVNGVNPAPNQFTGGEGPATGIEEEFTANFTTPILLGPGHYFFVPQVQVTGGDFLWLSSPKPITAPGTPFIAGASDLQAWIRNENLAPDWLRVGTDITHQGPFNMAFSLNGTTVPEPTAWTLMLVGFFGIGAVARVSRRSTRATS